MILLDTNVLIDAFDPNAPFHPWASSLLRASLLGEGAAVNPVILAELCVGDTDPDTVAERLQELGVVLLDLPAATSRRCAQAYAAFLDQRRQTAPAAPKIPLPDFFIGAHAAFLARISQGSRREAQANAISCKAREGFRGERCADTP